jgi:hypothetical protein
MCHYLAFTLSRADGRWKNKTWGNRPWLRAGLKFDAKGTTQWTIAWFHPKKNDGWPDEIPRSIASISSPIAPGRLALDIAKMSKAMEREAQNWKII